LSEYVASAELLFFIMTIHPNVKALARNRPWQDTLYKPSNCVDD